MRRPGRLPRCKKHPEIFEGVVISQIRESDPQADAAIRSGSFVEFTGPRTLVLRLRCRSSSNPSIVLEGHAVVEQAVQRLVEGVLSVVPSGLPEDEAVRAAAAAAEAARAKAAEVLAEFKAAFADRVPTCDAHLMMMHALPPSYKDEYKAAGGVAGRAGRLGAAAAAAAAVGAAAPSPNGGSGGGAAAAVRPGDEPFRKLWWPLSPATIALPAARAAAEGANAAAKADRDARAIEARRRLLGGGGGGGGSGAASGGAGGGAGSAP